MKTLAKLVWDYDNGDEIIGIYDDENIFRNVVIESNEKDGFKIISFEFELTTIMDETTLMIILWDERRNASKNYFLDSIKVVNKNNLELSKIDNNEFTVPAWIKSNAGWWADGQIDNSSFLGGIEYLIKTNILVIDTKQKEQVSYTGTPSDTVPDWIKNTAHWWSDDLISEKEFVKSLQFLINNNIISV